MELHHQQPWGCTSIFMALPCHSQRPHILGPPTAIPCTSCLCAQNHLNPFPSQDSQTVKGSVRPHVSGWGCFQ